MERYLHKGRVRRNAVMEELKIPVEKSEAYSKAYYWLGEQEVLSATAANWQFKNQASSRKTHLHFAPLFLLLQRRLLDDLQHKYFQHNAFSALVGRVCIPEKLKTIETMLTGCQA